jgi:rubrerythrin
MYKKMADEADDPLIRFLLNLIIPDEERHRELIARMVSSLKNDLALDRRVCIVQKVIGRRSEH